MQLSTMTTEKKYHCSVKSTMQYNHTPRAPTLRPPTRGTSFAHPPCIPAHPPCAPLRGARPSRTRPASPHKPRAPALAVAGRAVARPLRDAQTRLSTRPCGMGSARSLVSALRRVAGLRARLGLCVLYRLCVLRPPPVGCFCSPRGGKESFLVPVFVPPPLRVGCLWRSAPWVLVGGVWRALG